MKKKLDCVIYTRNQRNAFSRNDSQIMTNLYRTPAKLFKPHYTRPFEVAFSRRYVLDKYAAYPSEGKSSSRRIEKKKRHRTSHARIAIAARRAALGNEL